MNCLFLVLLLCCCGNNNNSCGRCEEADNCCSVRPEPPCGHHRDNRFDCGRQRNDSCGDDLRRDRGFSSFPLPGNTCGCEEK